ncbi:MAG TPA: hypothetical protein VF647_15485 [Longimicrobium sp.]|jgi:hypothetical protein
MTPMMVVEMRADRRDVHPATDGETPQASLQRLEEAILAWPSLEAREWTRRMVQAAGANPAVLAVVAIGSAVRAVEAADDVDFLIIHASHETADLGPLPLDVDVLAYPATLVDDKLAAGHDLLGWAVQFGVLVFERQQFWSCLTERWINRVPLPSADHAAERAARARRLTEELRAVGDLEAAAEQNVWWLTQDARTRLIRAGVYPASRPELAEQLREIGAYPQADELEAALADRLRTSVS